MSYDLADVPPEQRQAVAATLAAAGLEDGHVAVEIVAADRIRELNRRHRGRDAATDVLSFPIDAAEEIGAAPRELGDVVVCPEHADDLTEAVVHGVLHLCGHDHEVDRGEMLELQAEVLAALRRGDRR